MNPAFPNAAYLLALTGAAAATAASLPLWRALCRGRGWVDDPGHRKIHHVPVPLAGGLAVATGLLAVVLAGTLAVFAHWLPADAVERLAYGLGRRAIPLAAILAGAVGMLLLGFWDDRAELRPAVKFAGQAGIALLVAAAGVRVTLFVPNPAFSYAVTVLWILTVTNALNFNDNMNGLCAGLGLIAAACFAAVAARHGQYLVALLAFTVAGALAGYLPFNFPRATVFLGDSGSHLVGFLLAVLGILPHFYSTRHDDPRPLAVLSPLAILAVPLLDLAWVVILRTWHRQPFWVGDNRHFSHQLTRAGLSRIQAVLVLWAAGLAMGLLALL